MFRALVTVAVVAALAAWWFVPARRPNIKPYEPVPGQPGLMASRETIDALRALYQEAIY